LKDPECPLCNFSSKKEKIYYENDKIIIVRTKDLKGHKERIMVVTKDHVVNVPQELFEYAIYKLAEIGLKVFNYTPKFVIMESTFSGIKAHWHLVATDLDPNSKDFKQILATPWLEVVGTEKEGIL